MIDQENSLQNYKNLRKPDNTIRLNKIFLIASIIILVSGIISIIFNLRKYKLEKNSYISGIPFLRTYFFYANLTIFFMIFVFSIILFNCLFNENKKRIFKNSYFKMLRKLRFFYSIQYLILVYFFFIIYNYTYKPIYEESNFQLSGHILATLFSLNIMNNYIDVLELFEYYKINNIFLRIIKISIYIYIFHSFYSLIWTSAIFHSFLECFFSHIIGITFLTVVNIYSFDYIFKILINGECNLKKIEKTINSKLKFIS